MADRKRRGGPRRPQPAEAGLSGETRRLANVNSSEPTHEEIARRAYQIYLRRGADEGHDAEDWRRAEAELRAEGSAARAGDSTGA